MHRGKDFESPGCHNAQLIPCFPQFIGSHFSLKKPKDIFANAAENFFNIHDFLVRYKDANRWFFSIATQKVELGDGKSYEGIGIAPDVFLKNTADEINTGMNKVLAYAIEELK